MSPESSYTQPAEVPDFDVQPNGVTDGTGRVAVAGEVDVATAPQLREALLEVIDSGARSLRLDVADVAFIDSAGLGVLIGVLKRVREADGTIELVNLQPAPRKVVEITGLDELFVLVD
jgi:anti-sigma B factor antagonist